MQKKKCDQPCDGCPWMKKNQTAKAVAASPVDGRGQHWFSKENILRHWRAAGEVGAMLPCHMTDENAPLYGGKPTKKQDARICVGLSLLARREVTAFMVAGQDFKRYREAAWDWQHGQRGSITLARFSTWEVARSRCRRYPQTATASGCHGKIRFTTRTR
jgi:hypothetical protein